MSRHLRPPAIVADMQQDLAAAARSRHRTVPGTLGVAEFLVARGWRKLDDVAQVRTSSPAWPAPEVIAEWLHPSPDGPLS